MPCWDAWKVPPGGPGPFYPAQGLEPPPQPLQAVPLTTDLKPEMTEETREPLPVYKSAHLLWAPVRSESA